MSIINRSFFVSLIVSAFTLIMCFASDAQATDGQPYVLDGTQVWSVPDSVSGREYEVFVSLPPKYKEQPNRRYPTLYITDADYGFPLTANVFMYMGGFETVKPGDARYNRSKDMVKDMMAFEKRLKSHNYPGLRIQSVVLLGENHLTVFPSGLPRG